MLSFWILLAARPNETYQSSTPTLHWSQWEREKTSYSYLIREFNMHANSSNDLENGLRIWEGIFQSEALLLPLTSDLIDWQWFNVFCTCMSMASVKLIETIVIVWCLHFLVQGYVQLWQTRNFNADCTWCGQPSKNWSYNHPSYIRGKRCAAYACCAAYPLYIAYPSAK